MWSRARPEGPVASNPAPRRVRRHSTVRPAARGHQSRTNGSRSVGRTVTRRAAGVRTPRRGGESSSPQRPAAPAAPRRVRSWPPYPAAGRSLSCRRQGMWEGCSAEPLLSSGTLGAHSLGGTAPRGHGAGGGAPSPSRAESAPHVRAVRPGPWAAHGDPGDGARAHDRGPRLRPSLRALTPGGPSGSVPGTCGCSTAQRDAGPSQGPTWGGGPEADHRLGPRPNPKRARGRGSRPHARCWLGASGREPGTASRWPSSDPRLQMARAPARGGGRWRRLAR